MKQQEYWIHFRTSKKVKDNFNMQFDNSGCKSKEQFMELLLDQHAQNQLSIDKELDKILELVEYIYEFVQIPVKSYGDIPRDEKRMEVIVNKKSKYESYIKTKLMTAKLPERKR